MIRNDVGLRVFVWLWLLFCGIAIAYQPAVGATVKEMMIKSNDELICTVVPRSDGDFWASNLEVPTWKRNAFISTGIVAVVAGIVEQINSPVAAVAIGGALGSVTRYSVSKGVGTWLEQDYPYGTISVNIVGSFLFGILSGWVDLRDETPEGVWFTLLTTGFLGGFTTFSTFTIDTVSLAHEEGLHTAIFYTVFSVGMSVTAALTGEFLGSMWRYSMIQTL